MRARNRLRILCFFLSREVRYVNPFRFYTISLVDGYSPDVSGRARFNICAPSRVYIPRRNDTSYIFYRRPRAIRVVSFALFCPDVWPKSLIFARGGTGTVRRAYLYRYTRKAFWRAIGTPCCAPLSGLNYRLRSAVIEL